MDSPAIYNRGGPVQTAQPGPFTCTQTICSDTGCVDNSLTFQCLSQVMEGFDISFLGLTMECDGDTNRYPYLACTCLEDFVNCGDNGAINGEGSPSVDGTTGYAAATTVVGKQGGNEPIQTAEGTAQGTQTLPAIQTAGSGAQDTPTKTSPTTPNSPSSTGAANKRFSGGSRWQLRLGLVALVSAVLVL